MVFLVFCATYYLNQHLERMSISPHRSMIIASPFLASSLGASSSKPLIYSSILYAVVGASITFIIPLGHPGPLALVLFSTTASTVVQQPSRMVFTVTSTCAVLLTQLTGPVKLNLPSLASPKRRPSLGDHHPKNKVASPGARTTASVIHSGMSAINKPLHM